MSGFTYIANGTEVAIDLAPVPEPGQEQPVPKIGNLSAVPYDGSLRSSTSRPASELPRRFSAPGAPLCELQKPSAQKPGKLVAPMANSAASATARMYATDAFVVGGASPSIVKRLEAMGAIQGEEGIEGKLLFKAPGIGPEAVAAAFQLSQEAVKAGAAYAHPNFLRRIVKPQTFATKPKVMWNHAMIGVAEAWKTTKGSASISVAVLDEGVDTLHEALQAAVKSQRDFIGNQATAMPSGNDAHGTACAGIICSRDQTISGIAPKVQLIAARIAMDDGSGNWLYEDFATADAIDWCWREGADVLSNSWGGGLPSDVVTRAFQRARTLGRQGKGAVVVIAAGNAEKQIDFPGSLPGFVVVGASNEKDQRKTKKSDDSEPFWGSNFGDTLGLLAPGINIATTDISGKAGYSDNSNFTETFNGTSAATPHVAAAAALVLSVDPTLTASQVRGILLSTAKKLKNQTKWTPEEGEGRLDVAAAVKAAAAPQTSPTGQPTSPTSEGSGTKSPKKPAKSSVKKSTKKSTKKGGKPGTKKTAATRKGRRRK